MVLCLVGDLAVLRALREPDAPRALWWFVVPATLLAMVYGALLSRGPFDELRGR